MKRHPARGQDLQSGCGLKKIPDSWGSLDHVLEVVEDQEKRLCREEVSQSIGRGLPALLAEAKRRRDGRRNKSGVGHGREWDEVDAIGEVVEHLGSRLQCQARLPATART